MRTISREEVVRAVEEEHAQLVEVLPRRQYEHAHLPGAVSLPLKELDPDDVGLDRDRPVVVYCSNFL